MGKIQELPKVNPPENTPDGGWRSWWRTFCDFMIDKSLPEGPVDNLTEYDKKARFYPYLPPLEEQRDWLEKQYIRQKKRS
ncbi:hypothetical protein V0288_06085 [Pannus brasiliensis CCIBt3594]|uniref:Uncharacterized protein n=1 Tax=Pannus brasiliensis CCIBt3594 TaxID=1427578 RepID=A0AAW9QNJ2_9CHRO